MDLRQGDVLANSYTIDSAIGRGGMATVYKAYHERLDRHVAIKLMHTTFLQDEDFRARFQREARIVAKLEHPAIVQIYDYNEHNNIPFLVMKHIRGMTLKKHYIKKGLTLGEIEGYLTDVAHGLDYAHERGILHRDMKPSNILIEDDSEQAYITDFGLARIVEAGASTISHDMMLGTPFYISPEQAQGDKDLDRRTDVYSLGVILYELLTGQVPFRADTPYAIVHGHIYTKPEKPSSINPDITPAIDAVVEKALAKEPNQRFDTAGDLMLAFSEAIVGSTATPAPKIVEIQPQQNQAPSPYDVLDSFVGQSANTDLDGETIMTPSEAQNSAAHRPSGVIESPKRKAEMRAEFDIDMGNLSWQSIQRGVVSGARSMAEMIEESIDTELRQRRGIALTEEEIARRRVMKRLEVRQEFVGHLATYLMVNAFLVGIWFFTGAGFFWPFFPIFFWGMSVVAQGVEYYNKYGPGAAEREERIRREVDAEMGRSPSYEYAQKPKKNDDFSRLVDEKRSERGGVRLTEDGELTDSFIEERRSSQR
ncbi:MAG: protein kinase [Chloroflexota bacterium]